MWHVFDPRLPDVQGDHVGGSRIRAFFEKMDALRNGTFRVAPVSIAMAGEEWVVVQTRNTMRFGDQRVETDVVVVWRIVAGRVQEVWDIPSIHAANAPRDFAAP